MEEQTKPFGLVDAILLLEVAATVDAANIATFFAMVIPIVGEVVLGADKVLDAGASFLILGVFVFKTRSFGAAGIIQVAGSIASMVGIPAQTITVLIGIYLANHPKVAGIATLATTAALTAGTTAAAAEGAAIAEEAAAEARVATAATKSTGDYNSFAASDAKLQKPHETPRLQNQGREPAEEPQAA